MVHRSAHLARKIDAVCHDEKDRHVCPHCLRSEERHGHATNVNDSTLRMMRPDVSFFPGGVLNYLLSASR
jgi:hypothetical protein